MNNYNKEERLKIILDIINKLKEFRFNNEIINLYDNKYSFMNDFKEISKRYIEYGDDEKGFIDFHEINKKIEYYFPKKNYKKCLFVIRMKK
jgi:hypothetical protein